MTEIMFKKRLKFKKMMWLCKITLNKICTVEPEYGTIYTAVLGFFLAIEGGVHMGKDLKGRDLGVGIYQRQDGLYSARSANPIY